MTEYHEISNHEELEEFFASPGNTPALLFLFDPFCGINRRARAQLDQLDEQVHIVNVAAAPQLGKAIEARTGVRHESPQVIVFHRGHVQWHASHGRIDAMAVARATAPDNGAPKEG